MNNGCVGLDGWDVDVRCWLVGLRHLSSRKKQTQNDEDTAVDGCPNAFMLFYAYYAYAYVIMC